MKKVLTFIVMALCGITSLVFVAIAFYCLWQMTLASDIIWYYGAVLCTIACAFYGYFFNKAYNVWYYDC